MKKIIDLLRENEYVISEGVLALFEDLHPDLKSVLDNESYPAAHKITMFTKKTRQMIKNGEDTGLEEDKPKKGSSRAVWFPKTPKNIVIDGTPTNVHTAVKVAFKGQLDAFTGDKKLLGEQQNEVEADQSNHHYSILRPSEHTPGEYETNEHGILASVLDSHSEGHWTEMVKASKFDHSKFKEATKTEEMPKGMTFKDFSAAVLHEHELSKGLSGDYLVKHMSEEHHQAVLDHPFTQSVLNYCYDTGTHPEDIARAPRNWGIFTHPITGKHHPVIVDYGYNHDTHKAYQKARQKQCKW